MSTKKKIVPLNRKIKTKVYKDRSKGEDQLKVQWNISEEDLEKRLSNELKIHFPINEVSDYLNNLMYLHMLSKKNINYDMEIYNYNWLIPIIIDQSSIENYTNITNLLLKIYNKKSGGLGYDFSEDSLIKIINPYMKPPPSNIIDNINISSFPVTRLCLQYSNIDKLKMRQVLKGESVYVVGFLLNYKKYIHNIPLLFFTDDYIVFNKSISNEIQFFGKSGSIKYKNSVKLDNKFVKYKILNDYDFNNFKSFISKIHYQNSYQKNNYYLLQEYKFRKKMKEMTDLILDNNLYINKNNKIFGKFLQLSLIDEYYNNLLDNKTNDIEILIELKKRFDNGIFMLLLMIYNNNYFKDKNKFVNILNDFIKKQQLIEKHNKNLLKIKNKQSKLQIKDSNKLCFKY